MDDCSSPIVITDFFSARKKPSSLRENKKDIGSPRASGSEIGHRSYSNAFQDSPVASGTKSIFNFSPNDPIFEPFEVDDDCAENSRKFTDNGNVQDVVDISDTSVQFIDEEVNGASKSNAVEPVRFTSLKPRCDFDADSDDDDLLQPLSQRLGIKATCSSLLPSSSCSTTKVPVIKTKASFKSPAVSKLKAKRRSTPRKVATHRVDLIDDGLKETIADEDPFEVSEFVSPAHKKTKKIKKKTPLARHEVRKRKELEAQQKKVEREVNGQQSLKNCLKNCFAKVDANIFELKMFKKDELDEMCKEFDILYELVQSPKVSNSIKWARNKKSMAEDGVQTQTEQFEEDIILVIIDQEQTVRMIHANQLVTSDGSGGDDDPECPTLVKFIDQLADIEPNIKNITLAIHGLEGYFSSLKNKANREFMAEINGTKNSKKSTSRRKSLHLPKISRQDIEVALIELEMNKFENEVKVNIVRTEKPIDLVTAIAAHTRSVAEAPIKRSRGQQFGLGWYVEGDVKCTVDVKVPADVIKLWRRQLEQFPKISRDVADTIGRAYPTPLSLVREYRQLGMSEASDLLSDLVVGRAGGRRVGPEISRKVHLFCTSSDGEMFLGAM